MIKIKPHIMGGIRISRSRLILGVLDESPIISPILIWDIYVDGINILFDVGSYPAEMAYYNNHTRFIPAFYVSLTEFINNSRKDFDVVVLSHLHWDHASGLMYLPESLPRSRVLVQKSEVEFGLSPSENHKIFYDYGSSNNYIRNYMNKSNFEIINGDYTLSEHARIIHLPGHTPGLQGLLLEKDGSSVLIASDTVPLFENWYSGERRINGIFYDKNLFIATYKKIESLNTTVIPSHDPLIPFFFENEDLHIIAKKIKNYFSEKRD